MEIKNLTDESNNTQTQLRKKLVNWSIEGGKLPRLQPRKANVLTWKIWKVLTHDN